MNPFAIFQAAILAIEAAANALNPKRKQESKREQRQFLFLYFLLLLIGAAVVAWTVYDLYFSK